MTKITRVCRTEGCIKPHYAKGFCSIHYRRQRTEAQRRANKFCRIKDCGRLSKSSNKLCNRHYHKWKKYGNPLKSFRGVNGEGTITRHGYRVMSDARHILATKHGSVPEHRLVLFDRVGYGPHRCHWCNGHINWRSRAKGELTVDHLDFDKLNNQESNLLAVCRTCNWARSKAAIFFMRVERGKQDA